MNTVLYRLGRAFGLMSVPPIKVNLELTVLVDGVWYERCAMCYQPTSVPVDTPVNNRFYHLDGVGQLCPKCYRC